MTSRRIRAEGRQPPDCVARAGEKSLPQLDHIFQEQVPGKNTKQ